MSTPTEVRDESLTAAVSRRLRGQLAELRISQKQFQEVTGWGRATVYRRLTGETSINLDELEHVERVAGIRMQYLLTGVGPALVQSVDLQTLAA